MSQEQSQNIDTETLVKQAIGGVKKYTVDGETIESHDLEEQLKAIDYLAKAKASKSKTKGIRFIKFNTPGPEK